MIDSRNIILSGFGWEAEISPEFGMNTVSLTYQGNSLLRCPHSVEAFHKSPVVYGSPLLLPPNRTEDAAFTFRGQHYTMPMNDPKSHNNLHGALYRSPFRILEQSADHVTARFENRGEIFPFPFRLTVHFYLDETGYHQSFTVENTGSHDMPLTFGLHTNFRAPKVFRVPLLHKWETNDRHLPTGKKLELTELEQSYCTGADPQGYPISGFFPAAGHTAQLDDLLYTVSDNFNHWILWNGTGDRGFMSIEPQQGNVNCLNSGIGLLSLAPGEKEEYTTWYHFA